jgi:hypothetical protein
MATIPSPFASTSNRNNNQSLLTVGTTSFDVDNVSTSPTPSETTEVGANAVLITGVTTNKYNNLRWEDCDYNAEGEPIGIDNKTWKQIQVVKLHKICSKLQVYGVKNAKKDNIIESILTTYKNNVAYNTLKEMTMMETGINKENIVTNQPNQSTAPRKEPQCPYRLMNILFSDDFAEEFGTTANTPHRSTLDTGKAANEVGFWEKIQAAFSISKFDYNVLQFQEDDVFASEALIYPGKIVLHDWKKLRSMWKGINADYKAALTRFTQSGTHAMEKKKLIIFVYYYLKNRTSTRWLRRIYRKPVVFSLQKQKTNDNNQLIYAR